MEYSSFGRLSKMERAIFGRLSLDQPPPPKKRHGRSYFLAKLLPFSGFKKTTMNGLFGRHFWQNLNLFLGENNPINALFGRYFGQNLRYHFLEPSTSDKTSCSVGILGKTLGTIFWSQIHPIKRLVRSVFRAKPSVPFSGSK